MSPNANGELALARVAGPKAVERLGGDVPTDDEHGRSTWTAQQERWRGTVEATMQGLENRHRENIEQSDRRIRDGEYKLDALRDGMKKEIDALRTTLSDGQTEIMERIAKSDSSVRLIIGVGALAGTVAMALLQWFLSTIK